MVQSNKDLKIIYISEERGQEQEHLVTNGKE